jgi:hypothetical protein
VTTPLRQPALEDRPDLDALLLPIHHDHTTLAPIVEGGRMALGALTLDTQRETAPLLAGLDVYAGETARVAALLVWSDVAAQFDAADPDDGGRYWADRDAAHMVLRGLTPGLDDATRTALGDQLIDAARELDDLERHRLAGTTPTYLARKGTTARQAMEADVACRVEDRGHVAAHLAARWDGGTR